eukprot:CAMPEP_0197911020 /NCGR_PEP_ID=MMETSP1439-20131203/72017_1 /TAXON_ID=66791 /ORGANISM="Gonyaulax spinifera, Strain CCMP409" /LENGTH=91 /DNA_ID=CAMNT_0043532727 /DNA_START=1 /DNA_END=273 /DNA_ORIENTATION=+
MWSLATLQIPDEALLKQVAILATASISVFKPFELSTLLWAFAKIDIPDTLTEKIHLLFCAASGHIQRSLSEFSMRSLAMLAWAFAAARQQD